MSRTEKAKERYLLIFLSIIILALRLWFISEMQGPFVFSDQVGYWGHAANLNALPWQKATGIWYSYGYSILLTPLFWISHDMGVMYKLAIVLNAFIGLAGFYLGIAILRELEVNVEAKTRALISFTASCYSAYIFQTYIAWPETLIYTAILLVVWSMIRFCKKTTILNMLIVTVELVALYTIHNRNIVGIIAFFMILITMVFNRKVDWKKVVVAFITFGFFYLINKVARMYFTELMWGVDKTFGSNDVSGVVDNLKTALSSMGGWTRLVQSALGKIWYLLTSTFMLGYVGFVFILRKIAAYFRAREKKISDTEYAYFFIFLLILGTVALNILCVPGEIDYSQSTRLDVYFYGRYTDGITGLLIILGLVSLVKVKDFFLRETIVGIGSYCLCAGTLYVQLRNVKDYWINSMQVPGVYFYPEFTIEGIKGISIIVLCVYLIGSIGKRMLPRKSNKMRENMVMSVSIIMVLAFWIIAINGIQGCIISGQHWGGYYSEIYEILNDNSSNKIFYLPDRHNTRCVLRTRAVEGQFYYDSTPDIDEENYFVIISEEEAADEINFLSKDYYVVCHSEELYLICEGEQLLQKLIEQGYNCQKIMNYSVEKTNTGIQYRLKTEDMVEVEKVFGRSLFSFDNIVVEENEVWFRESSNINLLDDMNSDEYSHFNLSMDILMENEGNAEIVNKWNGWLDDMTFAFARHQDEERFYFNICDESEQVMTVSWELETMPNGEWNRLQIVYEEGVLSVSVNGKLVETKEYENNAIYTSNQMIKIGGGFKGKIKNFEYEIY